ncbi:MAG: hypothetical protein ACP5U0_09275 [Caldisphaera sp.]
MDDLFGIIFNYWLEGRNSVERSVINRKFLGYVDKSQYGKYSYVREGLMTNIPHIHVSNSLFIVRQEDLNKIISFFEEYKVELFFRKVVLTESDIKVLLK